MYQHRLQKRSYPIPTSTGGIPNRNLVVYVLYILGGDSNPVHTEDIALKCFELFPTSFSWVKYPVYPDKDVVRVALTDARKDAHGVLVTGRAGQRRGLSAKTRRDPVQDGWTLTPAGVRWIRDNRAELDAIVDSGQVKVHRQRLLKQLTRVRDHELFAHYLENPATFAPAIGAMADLLRCRVDAEPEVWSDRLARIHRQALAAGQDDVCDFVAKCREAYAMQR
jgi:hypothetical protein